jgi:hypothetical protein
MSITVISFTEKLNEICNKYATNSFIDIDIITLFNLNKIFIDQNDIKMFKKKLSKVYYDLSVKYHPDKVTDKFNSNDNIIIQHIRIDKNDIIDGSLWTFINDIYNLFNEYINKSPEIIYKICNNDYNKDVSLDHNKLKQGFKKYNNIKYEKIYTNDKIVDNKISVDEFSKLLNEKITTRNNIKVENKLNPKDKDVDTKFKNEFTINRKTDYSKIDKIMPYNDIIENKYASKISSIDDAFKLIDINVTTRRNMTFEEYIEERKLDVEKELNKN